MSEPSLWLALLAGIGVGALLALVWRARREQSLAIELQVLRQNVMLATPTSLVALLKAVSYGWKQTALAGDAAEARRLREDSYKGLAVFCEHLGNMGKSLGASVEWFNKAVGSLEQHVLPAARRFLELGLRGNREIDLLEAIASLTRIPRLADVGRDSTDAGSELP